MSSITFVSDLSKLRVPIRFFARGGINDVACFIAPSFKLIPWAAIMRAKDYVRVLVGPFSEEEQQQACAADRLLSVFCANRHTPDCTIAEVICHIWHLIPRQIDGDDFKKTPMEGTARWRHLCSLIDPVLDAGLSEQKPVAAQITVTTEFTVQSQAASDDGLELPPVTCVGTTRPDFADTCADRSSACFCGDEETNLPCRVDLLPLPNNDNLLDDYWSMACYDDDTWSQYTTRPSTAFTDVSTLRGSDIANEKETLQASEGCVTGCTDDLDELRLKWKSKGGMIVLEEVPARSRWHFRKWKKLICFL